MAPQKPIGNATYHETMTNRRTLKEYHYMKNENP